MIKFVFAEKASGIVKVLSCETAQSIVLEGFAGSAVDVSFANSQDIILATVDETGDLRVFKIVLLPSGQLLYPLDLLGAFHLMILLMRCLRWSCDTWSLFRN